MLYCASTALVAEGRCLSAAAAERHVGARGQLGNTLYLEVVQRARSGDSPLIAHCRLGATAVTTLSDNFPSLASPGESQTASGDHPSTHTGHVCYNGDPADRCMCVTAETPQFCTARLARGSVHVCYNKDRAVSQQRLRYWVHVWTERKGHLCITHRLAEGHASDTSVRVGNEVLCHTRSALNPLTSRAGKTALSLL